MTRPPILRSDEKLPRGSYFYVQVGHRYYAGEVAETTKVVTDNQPVIVRYYEKGGKPSKALARRWADSGYDYPFRRGSNRARHARDVRKDNLATYAKAPPRVEKTTINQPTGKLHPQLVDEQSQCKQYRSQQKATSACERLKTCYEGLDVKVTIRFEKGDTQ